MFSQNDEEKVILDYFDGEIGTFLDIGAYDGKTFSNTHQLALNGWSGVCVEASAGPFKSLTDLYKDNDKIELVNACIIPDTQDPRFLVPFYDAGGDAISSTDELHKAKWSQSSFHKVYMMPIFINQIERLFGRAFDFINIDIEGANIELALGMDFQACKLLCIEHDGDFPRIDQIREVWGFEEIHRNGERM
jgi:FkbM family methyltransferase